MQIATELMVESANERAPKSSVSAPSALQFGLRPLREVPLPGSLNEAENERRFEQAQQTKLSQRLQREIQLSQTLLNEILTMSRFDSGADQLVFDAVNLVPLLREIVADACFIAQPSNQEIEMDAET